MKNFAPCNLRKFRSNPLQFEQISIYPLLIWAIFGLPPSHIIDFVQSKFMKVQNQKTSNYKAEIQKIKFTEKIENDLCYRSKELLTLKLITPYFFPSSYSLLLLYLNRLPLLPPPLVPFLHFLSSSPIHTYVVIPDSVGVMLLEINWKFT